MDKEYLTYKELAEKLGVKVKSIWRYYWVGKDLPQRTRLPSGKTVILLEDYKEWFKRCEKI